MNSSNFQSFVDLLNNNTLSISDGDLLVDLQEPLTEKKLCQEILESVGYKFDDVRTLRQNTKLHISFSAESWNSQCLIYESWEELFSTTESSGLQNNFFIVKENKSSLQDTLQKKKLELFCKVRQLLAHLADQCDPHRGVIKGANKLAFIIETESNVVKYEFKPILDWDYLNSIKANNEQISEQIRITEKLIHLVTMGDSQDTERRSVMRSAFHEIISVCHVQEDIFKKIISSIINFHKRYEEHYEIFVKRFSINKVLHEINEQDLVYTSKISEILSNAQSKALTIPAALIAIAAVMKIDQITDGIVVTLGMLITTIIIHRSLSVYQETFKHICKQIESEFERYNVLNEDVEIRKKASGTKNELKNLLKGALKNSVLMKQIIWVLFAISFAFTTFTTSSLIHKQPTEDRDIYKELLLDSLFDLKGQLDDVKKEIRKIEKTQVNKGVNSSPLVNVYTYKTIQNLNLRSGPSLGHTILSVLPIDSIVYVTNIQNNWSKIKTDKGSIGWVNNTWLKVHLSNTEIL